jgi:hypothetical protein
MKEWGMLLKASPRVPAIQYKPIHYGNTISISPPIRSLFSPKFSPSFVLAEVVYYYCGFGGSSLHGAPRFGLTSERSLL